MPIPTALQTARQRTSAARGLLALLLLAWLSGALAQGPEQVIHKAPSRFSDMVVVSEDANGLRSLRFEMFGARQSVVKPGDPEHLELAYARAMPAVLTWKPEPRRILVVGLGGGTLPMFLRRHLPQAEIDVAELDPAVVEVARSHFDFREDARMKVHVGDGRRWIEQARNRYDLMVLDAFGAHEVPYSLATREFVQAIHQALAADGVVVSNLWGRLANPLYDDMVATYLAVFPAVSVLDVPGSGNRLVLASRTTDVPAPAEAVERAQRLNVRLRLRHDLAEMVRLGLRQPDGLERAGRVLSDGARPVRP